ncbi:MAG: hypothetical protein QM831_14060 [Kofleriaceae bacterium]
MKIVALTLFALVANVSADTITADKAANLSRALKFAGVKATAGKGVRTFKATSAHCTSTTAGEDEDLGDYHCTVDGREIKDGVAYLLQDALEAAGAKADDHMSQHTVDTSVTCTVKSAAGADKFSCTFGAKK